MISGCVLGLACPGYEQWYLAWVGLAPLFLLMACLKSSWHRALTGFVFGLAYNMTYLHWYLDLAPLNWLGFPGIQGNLMAAFAWTYVATLQALGFGCFALIAGLIPINGSFVVKQENGRWHMPAVACLPILWVLIVNRICNAQDLMGVPWTQLEYTQYKHIDILQAASIFGGIGVCALIVAVNVTIACLVATIATFKNKAAFKPLAASSLTSAYYQCLGMLLVVGAFAGIGMWQKSLVKIDAVSPVAVIQGGINIDMQKTEHSYTIADLVKIYDRLLSECRNELCVMTEGALPTYLKDQKWVQEWLADEAQVRHLDMVVGSMDSDSLGHPYNSAYGVTSSGKLMEQVYHKRYLVPFGEYTPLLVDYLPEWVKRMTNTPAGGGLASGKEAVSFPPLPWAAWHH